MVGAVPKETEPVLKNWLWDSKSQDYQSSVLEEKARLFPGLRQSLGGCWGIHTRWQAADGTIFPQHQGCKQVESWTSLGLWGMAPLSAA